MLVELTEPVKETIRSAAQKLTGFRRRQFQAEVAIKYGQGHPRRAEEVLPFLNGFTCGSTDAHIDRVLPLLVAMPCQRLLNLSCASNRCHR